MLAAPSAAQDPDSTILASPDGQQMLAGLASTGLTPDSVMRVLRSGTPGGARALSARAVASALAPHEQKQVARIRLSFARALPVDLCARVMWDGDTGTGAAANAATLSYMPQEDRERAAYLTWRAIGLSLQGVSNGTKALSAAAFGKLFDSTASDEEYDALSAAVEPEADDRAKCAGAQAFYTFVLSLPAGSKTQAGALQYLLDTMDD